MRASFISFAVLLLGLSSLIPLSNCSFFDQQLDPSEVDWVPYTDERFKEISNKSNNFFFSNDQLVYQSFFSRDEDISAILNTSQQSIYVKEEDKIEIIHDPDLANGLGVISSAGVVVAVTQNDYQNIGISVLQTKEKEKKLKKIYPFYDIPQSLAPTIKSLKKARIRKYGDERFNLKLNRFIIIRVSKERFARWYLIKPQELSKDLVNAFFVDYFLSEFPEQIYVIFRLDRGAQGGKYVVISYDLENETIKKKVELQVERGIYYDTTHKGLFIASTYVPSEKTYLFDYYNINKKALTQTKKFVIGSQGYPRGFYFNGEYFEGFYVKSKGISFTEWR